MHDLGDSTFGLVARDDHSVDQARHQAERRAREFCATRGGRMLAVTSANRSAPHSPDTQFARYELVFQCVGLGQPTGLEGPSPGEALQRLRRAEDGR